MIYYDKINFNDKETYKYSLTKKKIFVTGENLGYWNLCNPDGLIVAKCMSGVVAVYPGYMWDGSTIVGDYYEDEVTLEASLIHDVLYNAKKNPQDKSVPFSLFKADKIFKDYLISGYRKKGNWFQKYIFPHLYKWGLWFFGLPWKFGNNEYYILKEIQ